MASTNKAENASRSRPGRPNLDGFVFTERLGSGTYATVYKAYRKNGEEREVYAIKCIQKSSLNRSSVENLLVEIEILKQINHPHIVKMLDFRMNVAENGTGKVKVYVDPMWDASYIYIIMEYCGGGDLSRFISSRRALPEYIVKRFLQQIASALQLLHNHNISHMDLKPQNILLTSENQPILKLADFGFAQFLDSSANDSLKGSPLYMAPEIITKRQYGAKVDLWSVGVILYECLFGKAPFASTSFVELENKIKSNKPIELPQYPKVSGELRSLLHGLLQRNPDDRISFDEFFLDPFVDLEHKPSPECLPKATDIVTKAVAKDKEGKQEEAAKLYDESDKRKKEALRQKVKQYIARAEELSNVSTGSQDDSLQQQKILGRLSHSNPEISSALQTLFSAQQKESEGKLKESMDLYESSLEALISLSSNEKDIEVKKYLRSQIESHLRRAEIVREKLLNGQPEARTSNSMRQSSHEMAEMENSRKCSIQ